MQATETNPLETCEIPEGFTRSEERRLGPCLSRNGTWINWTRHYEKLSNGKAAGPFHVTNYKRRLDAWAATLEQAAAIAEGVKP